MEALLLHDDTAPPAARMEADADRRLLLFIGPALEGEVAVSASLGRMGWRCLWMADAEAARRAGAHARFDAIVLRAQGEGGPAPRVIGGLRQQLGCPVLVVSETPDEVDEVMALEFGADAWLTGPLTPRRLRAHLQALMRPREADETPDARALPLGSWTLDTVDGRLERNDRRVALTTLQASLLACLAAHAGHVVERRTLMAALGGAETLHARSVDVYIARLRRRLREARVTELSIEGVRGRGYTLDVTDRPMVAGPRWPWTPRVAGVTVPA